MDHEQQGSHMFVLTLAVGPDEVTVRGTVTPAAGATRFDMYQDIRAHVVRAYPELERATVRFFLLEPNTL
jgi:flagellar hook-basal body complex protein FliE